MSSQPRPFQHEPSEPVFRRCAGKASSSLSEPDPNVQTSNDGLFWCMHTQTCIGPDGELAEPGNCAPKTAPVTARASASKLAPARGFHPAPPASN